MRSVKNWVLATFILTFFVIIAGGVVRTTQSGMGCPDWPTCFGKWIPPTNASELPPDFEKYLKTQDIDHTFNVYHTWIEYFNRLAGVLLGVFAIIQLFLLYFKRKEQRTSYRLALAFLATVILTGLFGAVVVKLNLAHASISVHLLFAVVLTQLQLALLMSVNSGISYLPVQKNIRRIVAGLLVVILIQSVLGTMVRIYVDDVSKVLHYEKRETWLADSPVAFLIHRSFSWVVLLLTAFTAWYCRNESGVRKNIYYLTANIILSMITGIVLYKLDMPAIAQPLHLLLATIAVTQSVYILLKTKSV
jgi:cytochrome c oxidase assembly protein subunit 15